MRVLVVHNKYQIRGGEDSVVENETKMLREHGNEVIEYIRDNSEINEYGKAKRVLVPIRSIFNGSVYKEIVNIIKSKSIDIVHVHNTHMIISPAVFYAAKKCNVPVVMTVHNFRLICANAMLYRDGKPCEECVGHSLWKGVNRSCYRNSKVQSAMIVLGNVIHRSTGIYKHINFICLSEFNREKLLSIKQIREKHVFVKPNFGKIAELISSTDGAKDFYLFFGRLDETKGVRLIADSFAKMPDKKLVVAGSGPLFDSLNQKIETENIKNVELAGWCDRDKMSKLLQRAKAVVCASKWYEGHPMVVVESFAYGVPVITGDIGNIGATVTDGINGIKYQYDSSEALIEAVNRFETLNRDDLSRNALNTFNEEYSEEKNYKMLIDIYNKLLER